MNFNRNERDSQSKWQWLACDLRKTKQMEITEILSMR